MKVSSIEGTRLRSFKPGATLSINSFVSTSLNPTVAMAFLGPDPERDIMLEILVDKTLLNSESLPLADIQALSRAPDEEEVLLSMGTTLQVQSVICNPEKKNIYIQARLCFEEDTAVKEIKTFYLRKQLRRGQAESYYIDILAGILITMGCPDKLAQITKLSKLGIDNTLIKACRSLDELSNLSVNSIDATWGDINRLLKETFSNMSEVYQELTVDSRVPKHLKDLLSAIKDYFRHPPSQLHLNENITDSMHEFNRLVSLFPLLEKLATSLSIPPSHPALTQITFARSLGEYLKDEHIEALKYFESASALSATSLLPDSFIQQHTIISMADSAAELGEYARSLKILEDLPMLSTKSQAVTFLQLANHHKRGGDQPMAIACYRDVIKKCNLPPNSIKIVEAYFSIGFIFMQLDNFELALSNCNQARDLLLKHHAPTHPLLTEVEQSIYLIQLQRQLAELQQLIGLLSNRK